MTRPTTLTALCSALPIASGANGADAVPEWIHLLPAGEIRTVDGRGPYAVSSMQALIEASLPAGAKLALDEMHATDKGAPLGLPAPARGWIVELQAREDGLWGRVEWNPSGRALMEDRAYAGISPVIMHSAAGKGALKVLKVLRASLTNTPNLEGLTALHSEEVNPMDWKAKLIAALGLDSGADDAAVDAALSAKMTAVAPQSQVNLLEHPTVIALQAQNTELAGQIAAITEANARRDAIAYVDGAIAAGRVGLKPVRDEYIALHMADAAKAEKLIGAMPVITGRTSTGDAPPADGQVHLDAADRLIMETFGVSEEDYAAGLASRGQKKEAL